MLTSFQDVFNKIIVRNDCRCGCIGHKRIVPQTAFTLWGSHVSIIPVCVTLPQGISPRSFLLLFTALGDGTMRFVEAIWSPLHVFVVKHNGFERSNGPIPPVAQIRPGISNGAQMVPKCNPNGP